MISDKRAELLACRKELQQRSVDENRDLTDDEQKLFDYCGMLADAGRTFTTGSAGPRTAGANTEFTIATKNNGGFGNIGELMQSLARMRRGEGQDKRLNDLQNDAREFTINETSGSAGGFAVPEQFIDHALACEGGNSPTPLLDNCDRTPMTAKAAFIPVFADDSHSTSPYGLAWTEIPEEGTIGDVATTMRGVRLSAKKYGALVRVSNEWLADSTPGTQTRLDNAFRDSLRWYVEHLLWTGNGAGQPLGAINSTAAIEVAKESGQATDTVIVQNIDKMWARLRPGSHSRAIWVANQTTYPQLAALVRVSGTSGVPVLQPNMVDGPPQTINGRPLFLSEHLPVVGDSGDLCLLDPLFYLFGDRKAVTIDVSSHVYFTTDQTAFRILARFDGLPIVSSALTPKNGDTLGWLCKIAAR